MISAFYLHSTLIWMWWWLHKGFCSIFFVFSIAICVNPVQELCKSCSWWHPTALSLFLLLSSSSIFGCWWKTCKLLNEFYLTTKGRYLAESKRKRYLGSRNTLLNKSLRSLQYKHFCETGSHTLAEIAHSHFSRPETHFTHPPPPWRIIQ